MTGTDFTAQVNAIWDRYGADMLWSARCRSRGDTFRAELGARQAWARCERAFAALGEPANNGHRPELKLIASTDLPVFVDPTPANDTRCLTCDGTGQIVGEMWYRGKVVQGDGRPCQCCQPGACRPLLTDDDEEPTAVEGDTLQLPALSAGAAALEADINRAWALHDGRTGDAFDAAIARIDAELARVGAVKAVR